MQSLFTKLYGGGRSKSDFRAYLSFNEGTKCVNLEIKLIHTSNRSPCHEKILIGKRASRFCFCCTFSSSVLAIINSAAVLHG